MNTPRYTATVASLTRGWTYTYIQADGETAPAAVHLLQPLTYGWAFANDLLPGELQAFVGSFTLLCASANDIPSMETGDLITFDVRLGAAGQRIIAPPPMRVVTVEATADPEPDTGDPAITVVVALADLSADWRGKRLGEVEAPVLSGGSVEQYNEQKFRVRIAELARAIGLTIGRPDWWTGNDALPNSGVTAGLSNSMSTRTSWPADAATMLQMILNSHQPLGYTHTHTTIYRPARDHPAGWQDNPPGGYGVSGGVPDSDIIIEAVPASRKSVGVKLPYRLDVGDDGVLTILPTTPAAPAAGQYLTTLGIRGDWIDAPAKWRRSREHAVNQVNVAGVARSYDGANASWQPFVQAYYDAADIARGAITRDVPTDLYMGPIGDYAASPSEYPTTPGTVAANFMADASARSSAWALDTFTLVSSRMPQEAADAILTRIAPRLPGETDGDGRVVRHVTVANLDGDIVFSGAPMRGFVVGGQLTIADGDLTFQLRLTPGDPIWTSAAPTPITFAEWEAATAGVTYSELSDDFRMGDFAYIDA